MLSVLIPCYNYSVFDLVIEIHKQCNDINIVFEIIVFDDCSDDINIINMNKNINSLSNCRLIFNSKNLGRAKARNVLMKESNYEWLLFLDSDVLPKNKDFLKLYYTEILSGANKAIFGGICYHKKKPNSDSLLRWKYGKFREDIPLKKRLQNPYKFALISNTLIHKTVFEKVVFNETITKYGYEDIVFFNDLKKENIHLLHIENPCYHLNYEKSIDFILKMEKSAETLCFIDDKRLIPVLETSFQKSYNFLEKVGLTSIYIYFFQIFKKVFLKNLISNNPSLLIFDLYRLGHFCKYKKQK